MYHNFNVMDNVVILPKVDRDERIGSVFNHLFRVIYDTENYSGDVIWDFGHTTFFHPFFIAPLVIYSQKCGRTIKYINRPGHMVQYMETICFDNPLLIKDGMDLKRILNPYETKTYIPVCKFGVGSSNIDALQSVLQGVIERQCNAGRRITTPLSYFLSELVCNISQHSCCEYGYIFSQYLRKENCINLVIADDGITVFGSYANTKRYLDRIGYNEAEALKLANEGYSTKDLPGAENRGFGISTTKNMLVDGLKGSFFMLSGSAFHRHDNSDNVFVNLPKSIHWTGTIILMKIPVSVPKDFDYIRYVR